MIRHCLKTPKQRWRESSVSKLLVQIWRLNLGCRAHTEIWAQRNTPVIPGLWRQRQENLEPCWLCNSQLDRSVERNSTPLASTSICILHSHTDICTNRNKCTYIRTPKKKKKTTLTMDPVTFYSYPQLSWTPTIYAAEGNSELLDHPASTKC